MELCFIYEYELSQLNQTLSEVDFFSGRANFWPKNWTFVKFGPRFFGLPTTLLVNVVCERPLKYTKLEFKPCPCYNTKNFEQIHWNQLFCGMYGLAVMLTISTLDYQ